MILSLDVGTTVAKAVLFDDQGREVLVSERICPLQHPEPGAVEQDPRDIRRAVVGVLKDSFRTPHGERIRALVLSTQGGSMIPVRRDGTPTHPLITWMDTRAAPVVEQWSRNGASRQIREQSGWWAEAGLPLATIEWLRRSRPRIHERTEVFLSLNDYLAFLLTGFFVTNPSCAGEMLLMDRQTGQWNPELCSLVGISPEQLSMIRPAEAVIGPLAGEIAKILGVQREIPVINGGQDHTLEALAVGLTEEGKALLACGTAWVVNGVSRSGALADIPEGMGINPHVPPGQWIASQYLGCFGAVMEWWTGTLWSGLNDQADREELYAAVNDRMAQASWDPRELLYIPYSGGKQLDVNRGGGAFLGMTPTHSKEHLTMALMEGTCFEVRWALENLMDRGTTIRELWMIGGATRSRVWPQIMADTLGIPILTSNYSHGPALGAAMVATVSLGDHPDYEAARRVFRVDHGVRKPDQRRHQVLTKRFQRFRKASEILRKGGLDA